MERIDWDAFSDCVITTHWGNAMELERNLKLSHGVAWRAWNGKPIGVLPFLRICKAMRISANLFLVPA